MTATSVDREGFSSLRKGGLNWDAFPLRLFVKGNAKFWNPADIDFTQDAEDWASLTSEEKRSSTYLCTQFIAGEEAVTEDIQPFMKAMAAEGRFNDEMYLTQFCFEDSILCDSVTIFPAQTGGNVVSLSCSTKTNGARVAQSVQLAGRHFGARGAHLHRGPAQPRFPRERG